MWSVPYIYQYRLALSNAMWQLVLQVLHGLQLRIPMR